MDIRRWVEKVDWKYNLAFEWLGHIGGVEPARSGGFEAASEKLLERIGFELGHKPYPCRDIYDALEALDHIVLRGRTAYTLPWYWEEKLFFTRHYRPHVDIPLEDGEPKAGFLDLHFEYEGLYIISLPDRVTGEVYRDLLRKIVESVLDKGGHILLDITYLPIVDIDIPWLNRLLTPISSHVSIYLGCNNLLTRHSDTTGILYTSLDEESINIRWEHEYIVEKTSREINTLISLWDDIVESLSKEAAERGVVATGQGFNTNVFRGYVEVDDVERMNNLLLGAGILTMPIPELSRIYISLLTDTEFKDAVEKAGEVINEGS